ncbi:MAG: glycerophosphodiester phosphodiesterase family protein [Truepera sp.]|nr:glycerophosphodiester phosphodiesterase family protein [Truepera sp.]
MKLLASENGFVHVCGHRGHKVAAPENTLAALRAAEAHGATSCEIDIALTRDDNIAVIHDLAVDRTTDGSGLVSGFTLEEIQCLDASNGYADDYPGERIPSLHEVLEYAKGRLGLVIEIKEYFAVDRLLGCLGALLEETGVQDDVIVISFDHNVLVEAKRRIPGIRTEGITHARHVSMPDVARSADLDSLSIELLRFHPDDARQLHEVGVAVRCHLPPPALLEQYQALGSGVIERIGDYLREGLFDTVSGSDVAWLRRLVDEHPLG